MTGESNESVETIHVLVLIKEHIPLRIGKERGA